MTNVIPMFNGVTPAVRTATHKLDDALAKAVREAKAAELPQGLVVALLHAYALRATQELLE